MENEKDLDFSLIHHLFIKPLLEGDEDRDEYFRIANLGMHAWNYCLAELYEIPFGEDVRKALLAVSEESEELKKIYEFLIKRKQTEFDMYRFFIIDINVVLEEDESVMLYLKVALSSVLEKIANM